MASPENKHCANCIDTVSFPVHRWTRHTHPFNGPLSGTTQDFTEARDSEWQWHQLGHMQVCTSLQADNYANTMPLSFLEAGCPSCCLTNVPERVCYQMVVLFPTSLN